MYDVFVSYSSSDAIWVHETLIPQLLSHHFTVISDRDFEAGSFSEEQMEQAVLNSRRVLTVMTPDYFRSGWAKLEAAMARLLDPGAVSRKIVPVLAKDTSDVPLRFKALVYRDLRQPNAEQWRNLMQDLG